MSFKSHFQLAVPGAVDVKLTIHTTVNNLNYAVQQIKDGDLEKYEARLLLKAITDVVDSAQKGVYEFIVIEEGDGGEEE